MTMKRAERRLTPLMAEVAKLVRQHAIEGQEFTWQDLCLTAGITDEKRRSQVGYTLARLIEYPQQTGLVQTDPLRKRNVRYLLRPLSYFKDREVTPPATVQASLPLNGDEPLFGSMPPDATPSAHERLKELSRRVTLLERLVLRIERDRNG